MPRKNRDYKEEYRKYHSSAKARADRSSRNKARRKKKSCSGDIDHKDGNPRNNSKSNLRCQSKSSNRAGGARKVPKSRKAAGGRRSK